MRITALLIVAALSSVSQSQPPQEGCGTDSPSSARGDSDLYCIELLPAGDISGASGLARLIPPSSPFGLAVSPGGEQLYDIEFTIKDLPDAASLGRYSAFVAGPRPRSFTRSFDWAKCVGAPAGSGACHLTDFSF